MIYLFNNNIVPNECACLVEKVEISKVAALLRKHNYCSAIGHQSTCDVFNSLFPFLTEKVQVNRIHAQPVAGDVAISLKLKGRLPEGVLLGKKNLRK